MQCQQHGPLTTPNVDKTRTADELLDGHGIEVFVRFSDHARYLRRLSKGLSVFWDGEKWGDYDCKYRYPSYAAAIAAANAIIDSPSLRTRVERFPGVEVSRLFLVTDPGGEPRIVQQWPDNWLAEVKQSCIDTDSLVRDQQLADQQAIRAWLQQ